jgi:transcription elongation factor GreA
MSLNKNFKLTREGVDELRTEVEALLIDRPNVADRIKTAREFGDLSENAEYSSARQDQEKAESRIAEIEEILENVEIIKKPGNTDVVELGNEVELKNKDGIKKFTIVGSVQANPMAGKISNESPIGMALLGKKLGEEVEIKTPVATNKYKIQKIS